jgi:biopolymer transport protein ExbB
MQRLIDLLNLAGPVMYVLMIASVFAVAIVLERLWSLQARRIAPLRFAQVVRQALLDGRVDEAQALCESNESALAAILAAGFRVRKSGRTVIREVMQDRGRREAANLERFTGALAAIVTVAPLLGLLGTILGMIGTFQSVTSTVAESGSVAAGSLANGIWEALITTAAGLTLAIPAFIAHRFLLARVDRFIGTLEEISLDVAEILGGTTTPPTAPDEIRSAATVPSSEAE